MQRDVDKPLKQHGAIDNGVLMECMWHDRGKAARRLVPLKGKRITARSTTSASDRPQNRVREQIDEVAPLRPVQVLELAKWMKSLAFEEPLTPTVQRQQPHHVHEILKTASEGEDEGNYGDQMTKDMWAII